MGRQFNFKCKSCGYFADEISGGIECGMQISLETFVCLDCKELFDLSEQNEFPPLYNPKKKKAPKKCSICKGKNIKPWEESHPCPRCQKKMKADKSQIILWD